MMGTRKSTIVHPYFLHQDDHFEVALVALSIFRQGHCGKLTLAIENHNFYWENPLQMVILNGYAAMLNCQRVYIALYFSIIQALPFLPLCPMLRMCSSTAGGSESDALAAPCASSLAATWSCWALSIDYQRFTL